MLARECETGDVHLAKGYEVGDARERTWRCEVVTPLPETALGGWTPRGTKYQAWKKCDWLNGPESENKGGLVTLYMLRMQLVRVKP